MVRQLKYFLAGSGLITFGALSHFMLPVRTVAQGIPQGTAPVLVMNTTARPVPVTGSILATVGNTQPLPVTGSVSATVRNSTTTPLFVSDVGPRQPFQVSIPVDPGTIFDAPACIAVPEGKRMIIELLTLFLESSHESAMLDLALRTNVAGNTVSHAIEMTRIPTIVESFFSATHDVRIYANPSTNVCVVMRAMFQGPFRPGTATLSGQLIDVAPPPQ